MKPEPDFDATSLCFHCGLPLPADARWAVNIDNCPRSMCCPGCQAVAEAIVSSGGAAYYSQRSNLPLTASGRKALVPAQLLGYDLAVADTAGSSCVAVFSIEGIRCAACVWLIEKRLGALPGVVSANLNVAGEKLEVQWDSAVCQPSHILQALHAIGYPAQPFDVLRHGDMVRRNGKRLFRQLFIAGLAMMQVMMYAFPAYLAPRGAIDQEHAQLMRWASMFLSLPAVAYSALPFFKGAWSNLKNHSLGMDVPVALGILAAFFASLAATWRNQGEVYYDSITMFIFLLLCSRYLELQTRRQAFSRLEKLQHALPVTAARLGNYPQDRRSEMVSAGQLRVGDVLMIRAGEIIAADCIIMDGDTAIDASLLTGESQPVAKKTGDSLPGGAVNALQTVVVRVTSSAGDSSLSALIRLSERAGLGKPQLALWADRVAAWFVAALLLFTILIFFLWQYFDPARAWPIAIAVLVVSCPCALSLATPTALASAADRLLRQGVLVMQANVLETLTRTTHVIFDKTGTLTRGKLAVQATRVFGSLSVAQCLRLAAGMEASSVHPISAALNQAAQQAGVHAFAAEHSVAPRDIRSEAGLGLQAVMDGVTYRIGNRDFIEALLGCPVETDPVPHATSVYLASEFSLLACFELRDSLRDDAAQVIRQLQAAGKEVILLSGDDQVITETVAREVGIAAAYGNRLPEQKLEFVQALQQQGAVLAMVGDGINDAAVLRAADVSFAMGSGAALAQVNADAVLMSENLGSLLATFTLAQDTMSVIRQNLAWASLYNLLAIPAAACGYLDPLLSGAGMALSSMLVIVNALRLRRIPQPAAVSCWTGKRTQLAAQQTQASRGA
ncbi:MAG: heavy metal translocating P-type ATPase [Pseudomonadota bacterium]